LNIWISVLHDVQDGNFLKIPFQNRKQYKNRKVTRRLRSNFAQREKKNHKSMNGIRTLSRVFIQKQENSPKKSKSFYRRMKNFTLKSKERQKGMKILEHRAVNKLIV